MTANMLGELVLDVAHFPTARFAVTSVRRFEERNPAGLKQYLARRRLHPAWRDAWGQYHGNRRAGAGIFAPQRTLSAAADRFWNSAFQESTWGRRRRRRAHGLRRPLDQTVIARIRSELESTAQIFTGNQESKG